MQEVCQAERALGRKPIPPQYTRRFEADPIIAIPQSRMSISRRPGRLLDEGPARAGPRLPGKETMMATTSTYLNFNGNTEDAFNFYRSVFKTEFFGAPVRMGDFPPPEGQPVLSETAKQLIMHIELPLLGGHMLMGTDASEEMGFTVTPGNNVYINLQPDTRAEADEIFAALSDGGKIEMPMAEMFWGDYFGSLVDKFGVQWMVTTGAKS